MGRASKDKRDMYYRKAKEEGYRARSAYKLLQLHEEFGILRREEIRTGVVDLCAAPGSWSQVLSNHLLGSRSDVAEGGNCAENVNEVCETSSLPRIVAVDLQEMMPINGVQLLQGDITNEWTAREIIRLLNGETPCAAERSDDTPHPGENGPNTTSAMNECSANEREEPRDHTPNCVRECQQRRKNGTDLVNSGDENSNNSAGESSAGVTHDCGNGSNSLLQPTAMRKADLVVCDGAPDVTGMHELDEYLQHHLLLAALNITTFVLRRGGTFVTKMFRGPNTPFLIAKAEVFFRHVAIAKPKSSRNASMEAFLVCQDYDPPPAYEPSFDRPLTQTVSCFTPAAPLLHSNEMGSQNVLFADAGVDTHSAGGVACGSTGGAHRVKSVIVPFLACGDLTGYDADMCYDRSESDAVLPPVQPPLQAPYIPVTVKETTKRQRVG